MPSITKFVAPTAVKECSFGDVSIEEEYQYNLRYLQQNKRRESLTQAFPVYQSPAQVNRSNHQVNSDDAKDPILERRSSTRSFTFAAQASASIPATNTRRQSFNTGNSFVSKLPTKELPNITEAPANKCDGFSPLHGMNSRFTTRNSSVCSPATVSPASPVKVSRGQTVSVFDRKPTDSSDMQSASESCFHCEKRVYPLDRLSTGDRVYHKSCFRCTECNRVLSATNFAKLEGLIFCKPHYIEKFRRRGKYEAVQKPGSSSCSMTPLLKNDSASSAAVSTTESGASE